MLLLLFLLLLLLFFFLLTYYTLKLLNIFINISNTIPLKNLLITTIITVSYEQSLDSITLLSNIITYNNI